MMRLCCKTILKLIHMSALRAYSYMLQALQALLCNWLERYAALLEPTDTEAAMRDEIDLVLASIVDAELVSPSASMLRLLCSTQPMKLTPARICLIQSAFGPGKSLTCPSCRACIIDMAFHVQVRAWLSNLGEPLTRPATCCRAWCRRPGPSSLPESSLQGLR